MSWLATKYAWKCRDERVKGSVRLVLLAVALRVRKHYVSTPPTSHGMLTRLTFLSDDSIARCLDILEQAGEVKRLRRGKNAVYMLAKMVGPLFAVDAEEETRKMRDFVWTPPVAKTPQDAGNKTRKLRGTGAGFSARHAGGVLSSFEVRTEVPTTTTEETAAVVEFLQWFAAEFAEQRGAPYVVPLALSSALVLELLDGRTVERLQGMARAMFAERRDRWVLDSDYSLAVLKHRALRFEQAAAAVASRADRCGHSPPCATKALCIERVQSHVLKRAEASR